jgi:DNA-binding CsgD family transcriptional regulator
MIAAGYTLQNIADELIISKNTVKYHMKNIYMKLHVTNRVEFMNRYHAQEKPE